MSRSGKQRHFLKVVVLGDSSVGKTSIMHKYVKQTFSKTYKATIGADFMTKELFVGEKLVTVQIWDTAGQERFMTLGPAFYKGADCCVIVYDITDERTFENLENWRDEFLHHAGSDEGFPFMVIGNKLDREEERAISAHKAESWARSRAYSFFEASAKDGTNIEQAFEKIAQLALKQSEKTPSFKPSYGGQGNIRLMAGQSQQSKTEQKKKKGRCCG